LKKSLTNHAREEIKNIHSLSKRYNGKKRQHSEVLLDLVKKHAGEIDKLYKKKDKHFTTEVGDLLILCYELLIEKRTDPDKVMGLCYTRYRKKLKELLKEKA
jgi:hypothetical protein